MSALPSKATQIASQDTDDTRHNSTQMLTTQERPSCSTESAPTLPVGVPGSRGVNIERLDPSLLLAVSSLFPRGRGQAFVALLLHSAVIRRVEVSGRGYVDAAVISLKSIEAFARQHGQSKDTVLRYVTILEALGILHRYRLTDHSELHLPLVAWAPSTTALAALDALIEDSREKLQQLASGVKVRFLLLYGSPHTWPSLLDDLQSTLIDIQEHLAKRVSASKRLLLQLRIQNLLARLDRAEGSPFREGDLEAISNIHHELSSTQQGDFQAPDTSRIAQQGDLRTELTSSDEHTPVQKGDLGQAQGGVQISPLAEKGDFHVGTSRTSGYGAIQKGDFAGTQTEGSLRYRTEKGDFRAQGSTQTSQKGDFQGVGVLPSLNVNELSFSYNRTGMKDDNDNDASLPTPTLSSEDRYTKLEATTVARHLAMFLEKTPEHIGGFVNKCKLCTRTTIRAAVIDMLVHTYFPTIDPSDVRGRPQSRGAWFHDSCNKYTKPGTPIPAFIEKWLKTDLSWEEIELTLRDAATRYAKYMIGESCTADLVRHWLRGELAGQALDEALQIDADLQHSQHDQEQVRCEHPQGIAFGTRNDLPSESGSGMVRAWMDEYEAEVLAHQILQEARAHGVTEARAKQEHGVYVVELVWNGFPMTMKNPHAWTTHFEKVQRTLALQQQYIRERGRYDGTAQ